MKLNFFNFQNDSCESFKKQTSFSYSIMFFPVRHVKTPQSIIRIKFFKNDARLKLNILSDVLVSLDSKKDASFGCVFLEGEECVRRAYKGRWWVHQPLIDPLHANSYIHFLHCVLYPLPSVLTVKIFITVKIFLTLIL